MLLVRLGLGAGGLADGALGYAGSVVVWTIGEIGVVWAGCAALGVVLCAAQLGIGPALRRRTDATTNEQPREGDERAACA